MKSLNQTKFLLNQGFENIARLLIDSHAEIDTKDTYGKIPLFFAAQNGIKNSSKFSTPEIHFLTLQIRACGSLQNVVARVRR